MTVADEAEERELREEFNAARDEEYAEVLSRVPAFLVELETERAKGRVTYAEVEESEADLDRFITWLAKIDERDYFAAPAGPRARAAVDRCAREFREFEAEAVATEAPPPRAATPRGTRTAP